MSSDKIFVGPTTLMQRNDESARQIWINIDRSAGALKMQDRRMQDLKMRDQIAGHKNAGPENGGPNCRA